MTDVQIKKSIPVRMRDGVTLATDVYLPLPLERGLPAMLARTPYDKNAVITGRERLDVIRAVEAGYAVVVQDMRGRLCRSFPRYWFACTKRKCRSAIQTPRFSR
jgi:uncharacterized protein